VRFVTRLFVLKVMALDLLPASGDPHQPFDGTYFYFIIVIMFPRLFLSSGFEY
jgi:hypothetical protein